MSFTRRLLVFSLFGLVLASLTAPQIAAQPAPAAQSASATPPSQQPAYNLPPDKLAKAIALSRIRNILDIAGSLWGIAVLWLLLVTRASAGIEAMAQRITGKRWLQGMLFFAALLADGIEGGFQQIHVVHPGDLHGVLEGQEHAFPGAFFRCHGEQVLALVSHAAGGHFIACAACQDVGEGALARAIRTHHRVDFAGVHFQAQAFEYLAAFDLGMQVLDA